MKILNIPIEPIEERYSIQWQKWFTKFYKNQEIRYVDINPHKITEGRIKDGAFLDVIDTNKYKIEQLKILVDYLSKYRGETERTILFFHDLWFPGLTNLAYLRDGLGLKNIEIAGCLHAGTYDSFDFLAKKGMTPWAKHLEHSFLEIADYIFVATTFHKSLLHRFRNNNPSLFTKIYTTGFPLSTDFLNEVENLKSWEEKEDIVVFPHRLDSEKNPNWFDELESRFLSKRLRFIKTKEYCSTKKEYYELLNRAKYAVSFSDQETWGIAMQEATLFGAIPICPKRLSYPELYDSIFLYESFEEAVFKIQNFILEPPLEALEKQQRRFSEKGSQAIINMFKILRYE